MALRKKDGATAFVDTSRYKRRSAHNGYEAHRGFALEGAVPCLGRLFGQLPHRIARRGGDFSYEGPSVAFEPEFAKARIRGYVKDFFPSCRCFHGAEDEVRKAFVCRLPLPPRCSGLADELAQGDSVAVHVRRGDCIDDQHAPIFAGILTQAYYAKAFELIKARKPDARSHFFSDDDEWCRRTFFVIANRVIDGSTGTGSWVDMAPMSRCRHAIIANSSFSWWARWIGGFEGWCCVAPSRVLNPGEIHSRIEDFVPEQYAIVSPEGAVLRNLP